MKSILLAPFFCLITIMSWAQSRPIDFKSAVKIYNSIDYERLQTSHTFNDSTGDFLRTTDTDLSILRPVFGIQWQNESGHFHEIELTRFELGTQSTETVPRQQQTNISGPPISGSDIVRTRIAVGYQYLVPLNKETERDLALFLGLGGTVFFRHISTSSPVSTEFATSSGSGGLNLFISPRLNWYFSERLFLDAQIQVYLADMRLTSSTTEDPAIVPERRMQTSTEFATIPSMFTGRIGFGYKL